MQHFNIVPEFAIRFFRFSEYSFLTGLLLFATNPIFAQTNQDSLPASQKLKFSISHSGQAYQFVYFDSLSYDSLIWSMGDGTILNGDKVAHFYKELGEYDVCLTLQSNNESKKICKDIKVDSETELLKSFLEVEVFPNPTEDQLVIRNENTIDDLQICFYNSLGNIIGIYPLQSFNNTIDLSPFNSGLIRFCVKIDSEIMQSGVIVKD